MEFTCGRCPERPIAHGALALLMMSTLDAPTSILLDAQSLVVESFGARKPLFDWVKRLGIQISLEQHGKHGHR